MVHDIVMKLLYFTIYLVHMVVASVSNSKNFPSISSNASSFSSVSGNLSFFVIGDWGKGGLAGDITNATLYSNSDQVLTSHVVGISHHHYA